MIDLIEEKQSDLHHLCRQYRVARLEMFGSAVSGGFFDPASSDLDFLVEFLPLEADQYADSYFGLLFALQELFGRNVDLVMPGAIKNRYFLEAVNQNRETIDAA